jgi:hypothetical protein
MFGTGRTVLLGLACYNVFSPLCEAGKRPRERFVSADLSPH